jgi:hypothetical protein
MGKHLVEKGLEGVAGIVLSWSSNRKDDIVETATGEEDGKARSGDDELVEVTISDGPSSPRDGLVLRLKWGQHAKSLDSQIVIVGEVGGFHSTSQQGIIMSE